MTRITPIYKCINCKEEMLGCTWTDKSRYHELIEKVMNKRPLCESCAFKFSKSKYFLDKITKEKNIKNKKNIIRYGNAGGSDSSLRLVSRLSQQGAVSKTALVNLILKDIYGVKGFSCLKKQEPYFYNGLKEAIVNSYNLGRLSNRVKEEDKK